MKLKIIIILQILLILNLSCNSSTKIENKQFLITTFPKDFDYQKIDFDNSYDNYFIRLKKEIAKYRDKDNTLMSDIAIYRLTEKDLKNMFPKKDMKRGADEIALNIKKQIENKSFFRKGEQKLYPYSKPKIIENSSVLKINNYQILNQNSGVSYIYYSNYFNKEYEITREDYILKENERYWHLTIYITDKENREKIRNKFNALLQEFKFKKVQPNISEYRDLN